MKWNKLACAKDALRFKSQKQWESNGFASYNKARRMGWVEELSSHMKTWNPWKRSWRPRKPKWTLETCIKDARRFSTLSEWKRQNPYAYNKARRMGWLNECSPYITKTPYPKTRKISATLMQKGHPLFALWCAKVKESG